jgi:hypothetical protein
LSRFADFIAFFIELHNADRLCVVHTTREFDECVSADEDFGCPFQSLVRAWRRSPDLDFKSLHGGIKINVNVGERKEDNSKLSTMVKILLSPARKRHQNVWAEL